MEVNKKFNYLIPKKTQFLIRVGSNFDGGYVVVKKPFVDSDILISFGLGEAFNLEESFVRSGRVVHAYDHTVNYSVFVYRFLKQIKRFLHLKSNLESIKNKFIVLKNYIRIKNLKNFNHYENKINNKKVSKIDIPIQEIFKKTSSNNIFLSIDIEGDEYKILNHIIYESNRINLLVIEFHDLDKNLSLFEKTIQTLKEKFFIIHIHGNNCSHQLNSGLPNVLEMSFINKNKYHDLIIEENVLNFPIKDLDQPNYPFTKDIKFKFKI